MNRRIRGGVHSRSRWEECWFFYSTYFGSPQRERNGLGSITTLKSANIACFLHTIIFHETTVILLRIAKWITGIENFRPNWTEKIAVSLKNAFAKWMPTHLHVFRKIKKIQPNIILNTIRTKFSELLLSLVSMSLQCVWSGMAFVN